MDGTYPLPEAQLDRFTMRIGVGYPAHAAEVEVLRAQHGPHPVDLLAPVADVGRVAALIALAQQVYVSDPLYDYLVQVTAATRRLPEVRLGASPRGSITLLRAARVRAAAAGRDFATPEDVKALAVPVLAHRVLLGAEAAVHGQTAEEVVGRVLAATPVPAGG
jgi:MoxR-like ATPase